MKLSYIISALALALLTATANADEPVKLNIVVNGTCADEKPVPADCKVTQLDPVVVNAKHPNVMEDQTTVSSRIPTAPIDSARNVQVITDTDLLNKDTFNINSALQQNVSGANINADPESPNRHNAMLRGYALDDDWGYRIDGVPHLEWTDLDLWNIQSIEVQKGPAAAESGLSDPGGFVNFVTKKADWTNSGEFNQLIDNRGGKTTNIQQNYKINDAVAGRSVVTWQDNPAYYVNGNTYNRNLWLTQNLMFKIDSRTDLELDIRHTDNNQNFGADSFSPANIGRTNLSSPQDQLAVHDTEFTYHFNKELSDTTSFHSTGRYEETQRNYQYLLPYQLLGSTLYDSYYQYNNHKVNIGTDNYFTFNNDLLGHKNTLVTGIEVMQWHTETTSASTNPGSNSTCSSSDTYCVNIYNPSFAGFNWVYGNQAGAYGSGQGINSGRNDNTAIGQFRETNYAGYIQDKLNLTDQLLLNSGVRYTSSFFAGSYAIGSHQTAVTPDVGVVYKFTPKFSAFADYAQGYIPQTQVNYALIPPQHSYQYEGGIKLIDDQYNLTASYFNLIQTNLSTFSPGQPNNILYTGEVQINGVEVDGKYKFQSVKGLSVSGTYAYRKSQVTQDLNPVNIGAQFPSIPTQQANAWINYDTYVFGHSAGAGAGLNYVGKFYVDVPNATSFGGYTTLDLMSYVNLDKQTKVTLYLQNIGNKFYYAGGSSPLAVMPGNPFVATLGIQYKY